MITPLDVDLLLYSLDDLLADSSFIFDKDQVVRLYHELEYLKFYILCLAKWNHSPFGKNKNFGFVEESRIESAVHQARTDYYLSKRDNLNEFKSSDTVTSELLEIIQQCKPKIKDDCLNLLDCSCHCEFSIDELPEFISSISASLHSLLAFKVDMMPDVKAQIESLQVNLYFFKKVCKFAVKGCSSDEDLKDFKIHIQAWSCRGACLSFFYWALDVKEENAAPRLDVILSDLEKKMSPTLVDFILEDSSFTSDLKDQYFQLIHELKYLKIYMLCLTKWNDSSFGKDKNFGFVEESDIESTIKEAARKYRMSKCGFKGCDAVASELLEKIQKCKPKIEEDCYKFLDSSFQCEFSINELPKFISFISASLRNLLDLKADMIIEVKVKIESLKGSLDLFKEVFAFTARRCSSPEDLKDFKIHIQAWACRAACLSLLYWVLDVKKENMASRMDGILSDLQKTLSPSAADVTRTYLAVLKASKPSAEDNFTVGKLVINFVEFLKDNLQVDPEKDGIQMLFIDLVFLITFLTDRPEAKNFAERKLILTEADAVVNEVASLISSLSSAEIREGIEEERIFLLHTFLGKANAIKAEVRKLYAHLFPNPSSFNFPRINLLGFIDSFLETLREIGFHFPKHQIKILQEELLSLKESNLRDFSILGLQNKHKDTEDLWTRIVNVAYSAERAVSSFIYMKETLWHDILCLSDAIEEIKLIKGDMMKFQDQHLYDIHALDSETSSNPFLRLQANIPTADKEVVGFKNEVKEILGRLTNGLPELDIISIVGMPGLGKTTLAKKIYSDTSVGYHFNKCAWCTVSQTLNSKRMLVQILSDIEDSDDNLHKMEEEVLAERVHKSLKGQRYLIVMDDIWDVSAWYALKMSFPDDNKGSRIMFTSRIHNVVLEAKSGCNPFTLNPLSEEESWELLEKELFDQDSCPPDFVQIGKQTATNCKGLPLAIVLIASLLKEKIESLYWWKQVGECLDSLIANEDRCTDILELSYKHLPEYMKPCFLYFGLFPEDEEIGGKKLTLLWISEGFVRKHKTKSLEVVAMEYLMDLVARSLVIVTERSSTGGIKACAVHDLLRDFCIEKGEEEKVLKVTQGNEVSHMAAASANYRLHIQTESWTSFPASSVHTLLSLSGCLEPRYVQFLTYFKFLRVLNLDLNWDVDKFPEGITELVLLRYLSLSCSFGHIPPSIKRLENLEALFLNCSSAILFSLPLTLWEMQKLRHISALFYIPPGFCDEIPLLENVQILSTADLSYKDAEMFLRTIPKVRKLKCRFYLSDAYSILKLDFLSYLESLDVCCSNFTHLKLRSCSFLFPPTLKKLSFRKFKLPWSEISAISNLEYLEVLKLTDGGFYGKIWNVEDEEFLKLKFLKLSRLNIEQLIASDDSFPCLEHLVVEDCCKLEEIPSRFGNISTLKVVEVENCRSTLNRSVRQIEEEQVELGNEDLEVLISEEIYWDSDSSSDSDLSQVFDDVVKGILEFDSSGGSESSDEESLPQSSEDMLDLWKTRMGLRTKRFKH